MSTTRPSDLEFELNIDWLRAHATKAHFFGLGFIQVKFTDNARIHFYHPDIPAFVEDPHDHRYDFVSKVIRGRLVNRIWRTIPGDTHVLSYESCRQDSPGPSDECPVGLEEIGHFETNVGSGYHMNSESLHTVHPDLTRGPVVTLVERELPRKDHARVVRPKGTPTVCPFSRPMPEDEMWDIVEKCVQGKV